MTIDSVRDYWDSRPCNVRHSKIDIDENPLAYSRQVTAKKYIVEPHILKFAELYKWFGKKVLELGCGIGTDMLSFVQYGADVTAVDLSEESVKIAAKRLEAHGHEGEVLLGVHNIERTFTGPKTLDNYERYGTHVDTIAAWENSFDLVYSFGVIHHTPRPWMVVQNAYRYLKPGGTFKVMLYHRRSTKALRILLTNIGKLLQGWTVDGIIALESEAQTGCPITHTYTRKKGIDLLQSLGFSVQDTRVCHIFPYVGEHYGKGKYIKAFPWNIMPRWLFKWLESKMGWHLCITATKPKSAWWVLAKEQGYLDDLEKQIRTAFLEKPILPTQKGE